MKTLLLVLSLLVISSARSHFNYHQFHADNRNSEPDASSYFNSQQVRKPTYHHYPMTFFSQQQSAYSYQTTSKPYYATTSSLAVRNLIGPSVTPYWYSPSASTYVRPGVVFEYQFHGPSPHQPMIKDRYSEVISPFTLSTEPAEPVEQDVDLVTEAVGSHLIEASVTIASDDIDATVQVSTEVDVSTDLLDNEESTTPAEDVTTPLEEVNEVKIEATTIPDDITTEPDILTTESPVTFERHQSIIPFYLRPSSWRARSFGPDPRYYHPNHYYGPEEAGDLPSI